MSAKRRKTEEDVVSSVESDSNRKQADAHILLFLKTVICEAQNRNLKNKLKNPVSKKIIEKKDACIQTEEVPEEPQFEVQMSPNELLYQHSSTYSKQSNESVSEDLFEGPSNIFSSVPSNTDLQYFTGDKNTSMPLGHPANDERTKSARLNSTQMKELVNKWMQQYQKWFYRHFGVDVRVAATGELNRNATVPCLEPSPEVIYSASSNSEITKLQQLDTCSNLVQAKSSAQKLPSDTVSLPNDISCQTYQTVRAPIIYPQRVLHSSQISQNSHPFSLLNYIINGHSSNPATDMSAFSRIYNPLLAYLTSANMNPTTLVSNSGIPVTHNVTNIFPNGILHSLVNPNPFILYPISMIAPSISPRINVTSESKVLFPSMSKDNCSEIKLSSLSPNSPFLGDEKIHSDTRLCGTLTQYGVYGILRSPDINFTEFEIIPPEYSGLQVHISPSEFQTQSNSWMPPPPPILMLLRKQALICSLQIHVHDRSRDLTSRKLCSKNPVEIDYVGALEATVEKWVKLSVVYVYNKVNLLSEDSQNAFLCGIKNTSMDIKSDNFSETDDALNSDDVTDIPITSSCVEKARSMYLCDLIIGDVFVCQALAGYKLQAKTCAARKAIDILSQPNFLVGGIRRWKATEYLSLCLSAKADCVPKLSPFLADPLLPLPTNHIINEDDPAETYSVINPKPMDEFWLYTALPISVDWASTLFVDQILSQSSEFSQMTVDFEIELNAFGGNFICHGLIDGHRCSLAKSVNIVIARATAAHRLLALLRKTQPIVGLDSRTFHEEIPTTQDGCINSLWGLSEYAIVDSLMWGKEERQFAISIEHLEAHCEIPDPKTDSSSTVEQKELDGFFSSQQVLEHYIQLYAASAIVTPLKISQTALSRLHWSIARKAAHTWGLLTRIEFENPNFLDTSFLLVCKRIPLPRLKRTLFERGDLGVFRLIDKGCLSESTLKRLNEAELIQNTNYITDSRVDVHSFSSNTFRSSPCFDEATFSPSDDSLARMARRFHETSCLISVKTEPESQLGGEFEDCQLISAELNQPSNAIEILDDLPHQLIPGIDF